MRQEHDGVMRRHLDPDERLIWSGQPRQGLVLRAFDVFMIPFSLIWGGGVVFWEYSAITGGAPLFFALWGIPFVLVGLYMIIGRFFVDARLRANTFYGLTDRRAVIVSGLVSSTVKSFPLGSLSEISVREKADGSGTLLLGRPAPFSEWYQGLHWPGTSQFQTPGFEMIPEAKRVHDQLREAKRSAS